MRGETTTILVLLILVSTPILAEELNTTTYEAGDNFTLDNNFFLITGTYEGGIGIDIDGWGRILETDDCYDTTKYHFCVEDADNLSTDITFHKKDYNLTLDRIIQTTGTPRETISVELILKLEAPTPLDVFLNETTNMTILRSRRFTNNLTWTGTMTPGTTQKFYYDVEALHAGEYEFFGNATGNIANATNETTVKITDNINIDIEYAPNVTTNAPYNLTITVTHNLDDTITKVEVYLPAHVNITDTDNLTRRDSMYLRKSTNHTGSYTYQATYQLLQDIDSHLRVDVTTDDGDDTKTRTYNLPITQSWLAPITMNYALPNNIIARTNNTLTITLHNPNNRSVDTTITLVGTLLEEDDDITVPANTTINKTYTFVPNETTSEYGLRATLAYDDDHDYTLAQTTTIEFQATDTPPSPAPETTTPNTTTLPSTPLSLRATYTDGLIIIETYTPTITNANITIKHENNTIIAQEVVLEHNNTLTQEQTNPGTYTITLTTPEDTKTTSIIIPSTITTNNTSSNATNNAKTTDADEESTNYAQISIIAAVIGAAFVIILYFIIGSKHARARRLEKRLSKEQRLLAEDEEFLHDFLPVTNEDLTLQRELAKTIQERQQALNALEQVLKLLRKR